MRRGALWRSWENQHPALAPNDDEWIFLGRRNYTLAVGAAGPGASGRRAVFLIVFRDAPGECRRGRQIGVAAGHLAGLPLGEAAPVEGISVPRNDAQGRVVVGEGLGGQVQLEIGQAAVGGGSG